MKRVICIVLCAVMLLSLCACGKKDEDRPKVKITGTTREVSNNGEDCREADSPETEVTEETFTPVVLYDDEYCTVTQTTAFADGRFSVELTNKSAGYVTINIGETAYANGIGYGDPANGCETKLEPGEKEMCNVFTDTYDVDDVAALASKKIDVSIRADYDNGEVGVYQEAFELANTTVCVQAPGNAVSEKYQKTGTELGVYSGDGFEIVLIESKKEDDYYHCRFYVENNSDKRIIAWPGYYEDDGKDYVCSISSDARDDVRQTLDSGIWLDIMPGMGRYGFINISVDAVDGFALSANDVITAHIPVAVYDWDGWNWRDAFDAHIFDVTRDQLRGN